MAVTTGVEAKALELVVARSKLQRIHQYVAPDVSRCVLSAVDSDERSLAIVCVHPEVIGAAKQIDFKWNADVESYVVIRSRSCTIGANAHVLVGQVRG